MGTTRNAHGLVARGVGGRALSAALAIGLSAMLAGCGSTAIRGTSTTTVAGDYVVGENGQLVDPVTGQVVGGTTGDGLTTGDPLGGSGVPVIPAPGGSIATTGPTATAPGTPVVPGQPAPSSPGGGGTPGPGPAAGPIKIGVISADVGAIFAAFGQAGGEAPPSFDEAFVKYYNARGGIAGRKLELVRVEVKSDENASTASQRACSTFTQDNKVDIVVNAVGGTDILAACLKAVGIAMIDASAVAADKTLANQFPNWVIPSAIRSDRQAAVQIQQALSAGIIKSGDHLGVLIEDCPENQRVRDSVIKPAAAKAGLTVTEGSVRCVQNLVSDLAPVSNDVQRETLRFSSAHVTHVIMVSKAEAFVLSRFTGNASQQKFFPRYLVTSQAYPWNNSRSDSVVKISDDALPNIYGMGVSAPLDIGSVKPVSAGQAAAQKECSTIEPTRMGADDVDANDRPFRLNLFHSVCEGFRTFRAILEINGGRLAYPDVAAGFRAMLAKGGASAVLASGTYSAGSADRTDGATALRPFKYDTNSHQWVYTGGAVKAP